MDETPGKPRANDPTIEDVAAAAGVSIRTVSRVLNKSPKVNAQTRERIEDAIAQLNFRPSLRARAFAMRRSFLIGLVHNDRNALVLDSIQRGIVARTSARGYELIVHAAPLEAGAAICDVVEFAERSRVDGLVILPPISGVPGLAAALEEAQVPAMALSSVPIEGFTGVILSEERAAGAQVARHLLDLGHRRLAIINGPADTASAMERRAGFLAEAERDGGASVAEASGDYGFASGVSAADHLLSLGQRPTGIFAANDIMAAGVLKVVASRGIAVPGDLSVVGFDGSLLTKMLTPALTSVLRPFAEMAAAAADQLIARIEGLAAPLPYQATLQIVAAESTGPAPQ
ncbi:LacI family DNA-binding transcriptional regulator [Novosphingobium sp. P6W]|uniref:LacI family DNA-binding transcriptional regulator n=1 Tax=Novosphingobium sp. P6W TaxID=1609758 RepID=UPI0005C30423|nr:LacI family DNA-binding transcriptional regulator [Novosphingobium sp. P6W]AXB79543.1 LacI family transcriptional regulator [Novosphingobium sp. P6W]KIS34287.1 LacI family transcriptional regulator [Novosphingobium sp. P6W]